MQIYLLKKKWLEGQGEREINGQRKRKTRKRRAGATERRNYEQSEQE